MDCPCHCSPLPKFTAVPNSTRLIKLSFELFVHFSPQLNPAHGVQSRQLCLFLPGFDSSDPLYPWAISGAGGISVDREPAPLQMSIKQAQSRLARHVLNLRWEVFVLSRLRLRIVRKNLTGSRAGDLADSDLGGEEGV